MEKSHKNIYQVKNTCTEYRANTKVLLKPMALGKLYRGSGTRFSRLAEGLLGIKSNSSIPQETAAQRYVNVK